MIPRERFKAYEAMGEGPRPDPEKSEAFSIAQMKTGPESAKHILDAGWMNTPDGQRIFYVEWGNRQGVPVINLHGGPGTGFGPSHVALLDSDVHHGVFFDQPGCGDSTPAASTLNREAATECARTDNIENDLALLRQKFFQKRPVILQGTSWGSTMPLVYAERHKKEEVAELVIGSIFLGTKEETSGMFELHRRPDFPFKQEHEQFLDDLANGNAELRERLTQMSGREIVLYLTEKINNPDQDAARRDAIAFESYEYMLCRRDGQKEDGNAYRILRAEEEHDPNILSHGKIEMLSHANEAFLRKDEILEDIGNLEGIHTTILQGERDLCTLEKYAWQLHEVIQKAGGSSTIKIVEGAGHLRSDEKMKAALREALLAAAVRYRAKYGG